LYVPLSEEVPIAGKKTGEPVVTFKEKSVTSLMTAWTAAKKRAKITRQMRM